MFFAKTSILPESLRTKLDRVGAKLEQQLAINNEFEGVLAEINALSPSLIVHADSEIASAANLQKWRRQHPFVVRLFSPRILDMDQLDCVPGLEYLFLFHRDGYIREAALKRIATPLPSAFLFAAIAWRLNDWVGPVREAATECALRCFPMTAPAIVAEVALTLLIRENSWGRWSGERNALTTAFARSDVAEAIAFMIATRPTGPMSTVLRYALRDSGLDLHLVMLARDAVQPAVRATAVQTLVDGHATWPSGWEWRWIDKSMGIRHREPTYGHRPLKQISPRIPIIEVSANDPSAMVRRVVVASLIRYQIDSTIARRIAAPLLADRSRSVREQAEFIFTHPPSARR